MIDEIEKEEYDGRKDVVGRVLTISALTLTIALGLVTVVEPITLETELRFFIVMPSISLLISIFWGVTFLWFSPSYRSKIVNKEMPEAKYGAEKWTYVSFKNIKWKTLRRISQLQVLFFSIGMALFVFALFWRLGLFAPLDC